MIGYLTIQAQDISNQSVNSTDPKLSLENKGAGPAISSNPAKPTTPLDDPKLNLETNSKMREMGNPVQKTPAYPLVDSKLEAETAAGRPNEFVPVIRTESKEALAPSKESNEQPAGIVPKSNINYRDIKGADSQPAGAKPEKVTDYRKMNGPNTQPPGEKPKR
jgi:hypothetical protein